MHALQQQKEPAVGDVFTIISNKKNCKNYNRKYIISKITNSGLSVYYTDTRTNANCTCYICDPEHRGFYGISTTKKARSVRKDRCIGKTQIIIVENRAQRQRGINLKLLLNEIS